MDLVTSRPVACLHCRQRRSYCSKEKPSCSRCRDGGLPCVYEGARKMLVNESYLRELEAKAKALDAALAQPRAASAGKGRNAAHDEEEDFEDEQPLLEPFTQLSLENPSTSFQGPASSDNFLRNVRKLSGFYGDDDSLDSSSNLYEPDALPSRRQVFRPHARLPPIDMARRLFAAQYMYIGTIFAFTDPRDSFERLLLEAYRGSPDPSDRDACLAYAKVLLVLAFGQLYSVNQWVDFRGPPGFDFFTDSLNLLPETHEEGSMLCVETLALAGYFMQNMNRRDAAFQYIGRALRMAISLGLHQEVSPHYYSSSSSSSSSAAAAWQGARDDEDALLDAAAREHRRRVWWSVYSLDRILCVKSGNPITIQDEDIGADLPSRLPGDAEYCPAVVLRHYTQLSRILGQIHKTIYRKTSREAPRSGRSLMASVQSIILSLSRWNRELPDDLRFEPARLSFSRESVGALAHYYQCINMTVRPLLFHVVQRRLRAGEEERRRDWKDGLSQTTVRVIDMCVGAAQDVVNMMAIASQHDMVATYGYMDGEHIFSATIVLVMVCAAFPPNAANTAAMNAGLSLLRSMGERGNSHMGARYELLANLHAGVMPSPPPCQAPATAAVQPRLREPDASASTVTTTTTTATDPITNPIPPRIPMLLSMAGGGPWAAAAAGSMPFPVVDNSALDEPFYDESASTGMDFGLWEEGFAYPTMDLDFDLAATGGVVMAQGGHLSEFMYSHAHES
ncbi:Zn(2)-Cys(6) zinc finger domain protein [Tolypocladium capitatum]|uniref:Zn(2)-Cys(6) zinc finger domain protein n=1 Tax=Tolypocladium capitatum TaxID=45235 RepID=A0A2K3Q2Z6_9HYPO|nr:Zn(2)-Cys(6) zinc finger domain protein [Tolypocladium capitatum]